MKYRWLALSLLIAGCTTDPGLLDDTSNDPSPNGATSNDGEENNGGWNLGDPNGGDSNDTTPTNSDPAGPNNTPSTNGWNVGAGWNAGPFAGGAAPPPANLPIVPQTFDVVIFGAGTGGSAAALQAARMGVDVALVEETDWVGGQMTAGGVSTMDEGGFNNDAGIYGEFIINVEQHYAAKEKRARRCGIRSVPCSEPSVAQEILRAMLRNEGVELFERARIVAAKVDAGKLTRVQAYQRPAQRILEFHADVFIDATEYGDLLPFAGAEYRLGRSTSGSLTGSDCVQDITVAPIIKYYDAVPQELQFSGPPPGYDAAVEAKFRDIVVSQGGISWEERGWGAGTPTDWTTHVSYRATPDSARAGDSVIGDYDTITRTGVNWANDYPYTVDDIENRRFDANCEAKLHTLHFLYYVQNVMGIPNWAVANDEGYDSPYNVEENDCPNIPAELDAIEKHINPIPYIRESRRMVGVYTLRGADIQRPGGGQGPPLEKRFASSIAVADYAMDLHSCNGAGDFETGLESASDLPANWVSGPFQIPMEALIARDVDGLLAAEKNISQTRLVNGATRLQPSTMATGQAAGALAALAVLRGERARDVDPIWVQDALVDAGARIGVTKFADVPYESPNWDDIEFVSGRGILVGSADGNFGASQPLTRLHAAVFLARLFELDTSNPPANPSFSDVPRNSFGYAEVEAVKRAGITAGCGDGSTFCAADPVTRAQAATFLARGLGFNGNAPQGPTFNDVAPADVHYDNIEYLYSIGVVNGCSSSSFCPSESLSRRQAAVMARRLLTR